MCFAIRRHHSTRMEAQLAALHQAIRDNDLPAVQRLLDDDPNLSSQSNVRETLANGIVSIRVHIHLYTYYMYTHYACLHIFIVYGIDTHKCVICENKFKQFKCMQCLHACVVCCTPLYSQKKRTRTGKSGFAAPSKCVCWNCWQVHTQYRYAHVCVCVYTHARVHVV